MKGFAGFPDGKLRVTPVPNLFFSDLLPIIDHIAELKVTLYAFWGLGQKEGAVRYLRLADFLGDNEFMRGLGPTPTIAAEALMDGIERAVARGTFLHINVESADGKSDLYFLNTEKGRAAVEGLTRGEWRPGPASEEGVSLLVERPNIFVLYEQNIGPLTPLIGDQLREAEKEYPAEWIAQAIQLAVERNARNWRYVLGILKRWETEGNDRGLAKQPSQADRYRYIQGELSDLIDY